MQVLLRALALQGLLAEADMLENDSRPTPKP